MSILATGLLLAGLLSPAHADDEPPLLLDLEVNGVTVPVRLDEPFEVKVGGKTVDMTLKARDHKVFERDGVRFHFPATHAWEVEAQEGFSIYTMDGSSNVLMFMSYEVNADPNTLLDQMKGFIIGQYGAQNVTQKPTSIELGGRTYSGTSLQVKVVGENLRQDLFGIQGPETVVVLVIQDSPDESFGWSPETVQAIEMLERTWSTK